MTTEILKAEDFGLDLTTAQKIESSFLPKIVERNALVIVYDFLLTKEINPETCAEAKACRLKLVKVRTGIADIHKAEKAMALAYGKFCDAKKNAEILPVEQMEERLKDIELYYERIEEARIAQLKIDREALIAPYVEQMIPGLHAVGEDTFQRLLAGEKLAFEQRKIENTAAEQKAKEEAKELEKLRKENEAAEQKAKEEAEKLEKLRKENEAAEQKAKEEAEKLEKLRKENEAAEQKAKEEAEKLEKLRKENEEIKSKVAPVVQVKQGMTENEIILATIENLKLSFAVDNEFTRDITAKFNGFKKWAKSQIINK